jgi:lipoprotein signal peptidase
VIDFLDIGIGAARWSIFNLADAFIVGGVLLLMWVNLVGQLEEEGEGGANGM